MKDKGTSLVQQQTNYMSKEFLAKACSDFIEDILRKTFDEEDPISQAPVKCSQTTQTPPIVIQPIKAKDDKNAENTDKKEEEKQEKDKKEPEAPKKKTFFTIF